MRTCGALRPAPLADAESAQATAIAAYLDDGADSAGPGFDEAIGAWSAAYAAVADADHARIAGAWAGRTATTVRGAVS